jgi:hypothetical protein
MEARFINGATCNRVWGDTSSELLGAFQYETDAVKFAESKLAEDAERKWTDSMYVVTCTLTGKLTIVRHKPTITPQELQK